MGCTGRTAIVSALLGLAALLSVPPAVAAEAGVAPVSRDPVDQVDPFIGTEESGHTYPGATAPFGFVQLSPETDLVPYSFGEGYNREAYRYCAGYQYLDPTIVGFAHTHFSGTGHSDLGDILVMPTVGKLRLDPGTAADPESGYRSRFSHERESASPGAYEVTLDDYGIRAELTATDRVGLHRYTFPKSDEAHLILDLTANIYDYPGKTVWSSVRMESPSLLTGSRRTTGWARDRVLYFAMEFSKPVASYGLLDEEKTAYKGFWKRFDQDHDFPERAGRQIKGHFDWKTADGEQILVKVALSSVSTEGALANLKAEAPGWDFDAVRSATRKRWEETLSRVKADADPDVLKSFYTALYHASLAPVVYSDVDGRYRGLDRNIHTASGFTDYTIFSLWDTYRAEHPLLVLLQPDRDADMIRSLLAHQEQSVFGILPIWSHDSNENWCMIGYHSVAVIADAYLKGLRGFDPDRALEAMVRSADFDRYDGIGDYRKLGWVPADRQSDSASKTLEYAYDDWTIARMAGAMGRKEIAAEFGKRAASWRNLFDPKTGFLRARNADGSFPEAFDPASTSGQGYIEGNGWNYSLYVPQDVQGFIDLLGGPEKLVAWLDRLFTMRISDESIAATEDVTRAGMIGAYVHGNEPSHHVPYLYVFAGQPWKTQARVRQIMDAMYRPAPDGLCGNDDCGQMSAWYVFSALGFYPVAPGSNEYVLGSPAVRRAEIDLGEGRRFVVVAENQAPDHVYVSEVRLNGKPLERAFITHEELARGGELRFVMSDRPNEEWGTGAGASPYSMSTQRLSR
ncbi:MAG TPA: GH92 family glycosyl hydrolase [Candidatus Saccharimonadales bacterium]|nr:GH92 family glycosyl hydrolase [Candidatus Saccharimonadales bacterium]